MPVLKQLSTVTIDCADPIALAAFYQKATGWEISSSEPDFAALGSSASPLQLAFVRIDGYRSPGWPEGAAQLHLDFTVGDLAAAVDELIGLGASRPDLQPSDGAWVVLADPEGHPFCLSADADGE
jgi:catechol 2,3-dioxygenase-like lactoylglutathione lyase family enzyme